MSDKRIQPTQQNAAKPDLRSLLYALGQEVSRQVNCARIGQIVSFDAANQTATIQIAQQQIAATSPTGVQTITKFPPLVSVPVYVLGGGGYSATFPIAAGDECLVVFNDREIDNWLAAGGTDTSPTTPRVHDLADGMCFVGFRSYPRSLAGYSTASAQLRSDDASVSIDINKDTQKVTVTAPLEIRLNAPLVTIDGTINVVNSDSAAEPCTINGTVRATGDVQALSGAISLENHVHSGVTTGGGNTGPPV